jgi:hypothetical protein
MMTATNIAGVQPAGHNNRLLQNPVLYEKKTSI